MRELKNPYAENENYNCFGCSPYNKIGLKLRFFEDGEWIKTEYQPKEDYAGYYNILHGGIQALILDEIACWSIYIQAETAGVTVGLNTKYRRAVNIDNGPIIARSKIVSKRKNLVTVHAEILNPDGKIASEAEATYMIFPEKEAIEKFQWPGKDAFY
ncbi:MAG: PaaI family thioesterase [Marinifilaceae bacterium]|jgi:uncharacterized protein (TIGR00369 family)|nr:PaaI family thioesterase [Marinilabiliaceae bacterium JC040]MCT4601258.1 PaaI family thioesterase [Marinifilaceae bacterium]